MTEKVEKVIGIDLGTSSSCISYWKEGSVKNFGKNMTPSYVAITDTQVLIGDFAKNKIESNPANTIFNMKRLIGRRFDDPVVQSGIKHWPFKIINADGQPKIQVNFCGETNEFSPERIISIILENLVRNFVPSMERVEIKYVIAVPAKFNNSQRQAIKKAAANLNFFRLINESTAVAIAYGLNKKLRGEKNVLIIDLGGGKLEVSIVTIVNKRIFKVKATSGDLLLGGEEFDARLVDYLCEKFQRKHKKNLKSNPKALRRVKAAAEEAKRDLSSKTEVTVSLRALLDNINFQTTIIRELFEELCDDLFESILKSVEIVLADAKLDKHKIGNEVVLVGDSTAIPKIRLMLQSLFYDQRIRFATVPGEAVAYGAAIYGAICTRQLLIRNPRVSDVTQYNLGIEINGGLMCTIVKRNTPFPCARTQAYTTSYDDQLTVTIQVYEGQSAFTKDNNLLGRFQLSDIRSERRGVPRIHISITVDGNGIVDDVIAVDTVNGRNSRLYSESNRNMRIDENYPLSLVGPAPVNENQRPFNLARYRR